MKLTILGELPSKKNSLRPGRRGQKLHYDKSLKRTVDSAILQVQGQLPNFRAPFPIANFIPLRVCFFISSARRDRDNMYTTLQDVLVKAGVLSDDRMSGWNGRLTLEPMIKVPEGQERVDVYFQEAESLR